MPHDSKGHVVTLMAQCQNCLDIFDVEAIITGKRIISVSPHTRIQDDSVKYRPHHYVHTCNGHHGPLSFFY